MAQEAQPVVTPAELYRVAEAVARGGGRRAVSVHGQTLAITRVERSARRASRPSARENGFLAAYGSVPPLARPLSDNEMTEIAAEEAAQAAVRIGVATDADA